MMASRFASQLCSTVAANSHVYWQDGHAANGRKAAASARVARRYKTYPVRIGSNPGASRRSGKFGGVFMKYPG